MQKCENCGTKFHYKNIQVSFLLGSQLIYCNNCKANYDARSRYRITLAILAALPIVFFKLITDLITFTSTSSFIWLYIGYMIIIILIMPFITRYKLTGFIKGNKVIKK